MTELDQAGQTPAQEGSKGLSLAGLYEVFIKPAAFFERLKNNPKVLVPYVVFGVVALAFIYGTADLIARMQFEAIQDRGGALPPGLTPESMKPFIYFGSILILLPPLLAGALAMFWGNFVMGGKARFKQILSVMLYGELIFALGMLLVLPMIIAKDSMLVSFSLAVLVADQGPESLAYVALSKIGVFYIWEIIVIGIGLAAVYGFPRNKGYLLSVLSMGLLSVLHVMVTAIGMAFK